MGERFLCRFTWVLWVISLFTFLATPVILSWQSERISLLSRRIDALEERLDQTELVVSALRDHLARHRVEGKAIYSTPAGDPRPTLERPDER